MQSIPNFDYAMAIYARKSFIKSFKRNYSRIKSEEDYEKNKEQLLKYTYHEMSIRDKYIKDNNMDKETAMAFQFACEDLEDEAKQAMEAVIHNFNTLHCLPYSEKIWVYDTIQEILDIKEINEIYDNFTPNRYKAISLNKKTGKAELKYITAVEQKDANRRLITLITHTGKEVTTTDNHKIMLLNNSGEISEANPEELKHVITPRKFMMNVKSVVDASKYEGPANSKTYVYNVDENFARLIARYITNGYVKNNNLYFSSADMNWRDETKALVAKVFTVSSRLSSEINELYKVEDLLFPVGQKISNMLSAKAGSLDNNKRIPDEILFATDINVRKAFLDEYLINAGRQYNSMIAVVSKSEKLQKQLQILMLTFDENIFISSNKKQSEYECIFPQNALVRVGAINIGEEKKEFVSYDYSFLNDMIYKYNIDKQNELIDKNTIDKLATEDQTFKVASNLYPIPIRVAKESNSYDEFVYDISVEGNETFLTADGIFVHNSRAGAQVPFSSINFGTDTTQEGRLIIRKFLYAQDRGLGHGETPIFPISIFRLKDGLNYNPGDPSYDLFKLACKVSAKRLFPKMIGAA